MILENNRKAGFSDALGIDCTLLCSNITQLGDKCLWLGQDKHRMLLTESQVEDLLFYLRNWLKYDSLALPAELSSSQHSKDE